MGQSLFQTVGEFIPDKLIADNAVPITTKGIQISAGQGVLRRGTLLGADDGGSYRVTGSTVKEEEAEAAGEIGCDCILTEDVDAQEQDVIAAAYITGVFNREAVVLAEGASLNDYETELRRLGIFFKTVQEG